MPRSKEAALRRKKKWKLTKKEPPFPVPIPSLPNQPVGSWFYYTGFIEGSTVVVKHSGDMDFLYRMGFFGKGTLSRSQPNFSERRQRVQVELPQKNGQCKVVQAVVTNKRSYLTHKRFKALADGRMKEYDDIVYHEEQQQGFVDSTEEEEEEAEEEEKKDEESSDEDSGDDDSADEDSASSDDTDTEKVKAYRLLNMNNSSDSGLKVAGASSAGGVDFVKAVNISTEVKSHIVAMLAEISSLSSEQITTFVQVPQEMKNLAERYKRVRKAEVNMLQQAYAAKFPGRNFKKGEVITLDEDDSGGKHCGNESDNAVVISDSDDGSEEQEKSSKKVSGSKSKVYGDDDDNNIWRKGNDVCEKVLDKGKGLNKEAVSSKKDLADWSSDDSNFWSEEPQTGVKETSKTTGAITAAEDTIVQELSVPADTSNAENETNVSIVSDVNQRRQEANIEETTNNNEELMDIDQKSVANKDKKENESEEDKHKMKITYKEHDTNSAEDKNLGSTEDLDVTDDSGNITQSPDIHLNSSASHAAESTVPCPDATSALKEAGTNDSCSGDKMTETEDQESSKDNMEMHGKETNENADISTPSENNGTSCSFPKNNVDINEEASESSTHCSLEVDGTKRSEESTKCEDLSETKTSASGCSDLGSQSGDGEAGKVLSQVSEIECEFAAKEGQLEAAGLDNGNLSQDLDVGLRANNCNDLVTGVKEAVDSHSERHTQLEERSQTPKLVVGLQIEEPSATDSETVGKDNPPLLSDSTEQVTNIDSDNSNDSDDVICIESKSAEPKKLHHFLSQPVKKVIVPVVTRSVTFMSSITEEPTFVHASVGFQSWGPLLHFNFTGDPSHLPTVMSVSASPSTSVDERASQTGTPQNPDTVYERIYPPVRSLVPSSNSTGAVIKQRLRGLPFLSVAYTKILQAQETSTINSNPRKRSLKESAISRPVRSGFQPSTKHLPVSSAMLKAVQSQSLVPYHSPHKDSLCDASVTFPHVSSYLEVLKSVCTPSLSDETEVVNKTANSWDPLSQPSPLRTIIAKILEFYNTTSSKDAADDTSVDQGGLKTEIQHLLAEFHSALSRSLSSGKIPSSLELPILKLLLSKEVNHSESISDKNMIETKSSLSAFHIWLLERRFEYINKDQQPDNLNDVQKVFVDLTNNSDDKVHMSQDQPGFDNGVHDVTQQSIRQMSDPLKTKIENRIAKDLIADPVIELNLSETKPNINNGRLIDSDDSKQANLLVDQPGCQQLTVSDNVTESLSEEKSSVSSPQDMKSDSLSEEKSSVTSPRDMNNCVKEHVCGDLHNENKTDEIRDGNVSTSVLEEHVRDKVNVCPSLVEQNTNNIEDTTGKNDLVSEKMLKHSWNTLETENRKRKFDRSEEGLSELNGKKKKSDGECLLSSHDVDGKVCDGSEELSKNGGDNTLAGPRTGCLETESKSLEKIEETPGSFLEGGASLDVQGMNSCLFDTSDGKVITNHKLDGEDLGLDGLQCENMDSTDVSTDTVALLTKDSPECQKDDIVHDSSVTSMELTMLGDVSVKEELSSSAGTQAQIQQAPSQDSTDELKQKEEESLKQTQPHGLGGASSAVAADDASSHKPDVAMADDIDMLDTAVKDMGSEPAHRMSNVSAVEQKPQKPAASGEGSLNDQIQTVKGESNNVVSCLDSSESDSGDVSYLGASDKSRSLGHQESKYSHTDARPSLEKPSLKSEITKTDVKGKMQKPGTSEDFHIFIGSSSEDDEDVPPAKRHTPRQSSVQPEHPYSAHDDADGDLFVVANTSDEDYENNSDEDENGGRVMKKQPKHWRCCVKKDPCPTQEKLYLMLEEAFFLSFGLGCLRILDPEMKLLDLTQMWQQFQVLKEQFIPHYVAYHYFRSKGWVPKSGLKFGCDLILYREGPPFYHGSYSVVVTAVKDTTLLPVDTSGGIQLDNRKLNWVSLAGLNRITEHVAKELMLCFVIWPANLTHEESLSPDCISRFKVKELVVSRWVSSQERESKFGEEEIP